MRAFDAVARVAVTRFASDFEALFGVGTGPVVLAFDAALPSCEVFAFALRLALLLDASLALCEVFGAPFAARLASRGPVYESDFITAT